MGGSPDRTGSETGSSLAPSTITPRSRSTSTSGSVLLRLSWNGLDLRALREMERRALTLLKDKNPTEALKIFRQIPAGYEHLLGPDVDDVLEIVLMMGQACTRLGNESEAEALLIRAVSGFERIHGPDHRTSLTSVADLAYLYRIQGRLEDSEVLYVRAIKGLNQTLPSSEQDLAIFSDLASVYNDQGLYEKACIWHKRVLMGYRNLGPGHEGALSTAEINLSITSVHARDPATDSLLDHLLASCEARNGANHETVFIILAMICERHRFFQDYEKFNLYNRRLHPIIGRLFGKDETISDQLLYRGIFLAGLYSEMGRYEEAESLFTRLNDKTDEAIMSLLTSHDNWLSRRLFKIMTIHAEHFIRQSMWDDAEPLLLKAKLLKNPFCRRFDSEALVEALEEFRVGLGREAGALPLAQHTPGTEIQSSSRIPGESTEDVDTLNAAGSADFQQPFEDLDWSGFPFPSPSVLSLPWSLHQSPTPQGVNQAGAMMELENSDMMGMHDMVQ